ncbi:hypothetical protein CEXT_208751 [Caerostris extrusa]|uniref:Uncharacterized protein n=1 Tax=Caerostris extrusa TaxID=172846 RepID=A0AAV4QQQ5_CAEEX|nr:hypothetical protein CEXT_208751 [Caerostris extrusa]
MSTGEIASINEQMSSEMMNQVAFIRNNKTIWGFAKHTRSFTKAKEGDTEISKTPNRVARDDKQSLVSIVQLVELGLPNLPLGVAEL